MALVGQSSDTGVQDEAPVTTREVLFGSLALVLSLALHMASIDPAYNGPDAESNFIFAARGQDWGWWLDPSAFWGYLFPMGWGTFLALATRVTGGNYFPIQVLMALLGVGFAVMGWFLTRHISRSARLLTLWAIALSPSVIWLARTNGYEVMMGFLMTLALTMLWWNGGQPPATRSWARRWVPAFAGLAMGLCMLQQGKTIVLMPVLVWLALRWGWGQTVAFVLVAAAPVAAWGIRNHLVINSWNPFNSSSAVVMWMGNNWTTKTGEYVLVPPPVPPGETFYSASLQFIESQPEMAYTLLLRRMVHMLEPMYFYPDTHGLPGVNILLHLFVIALSVVGVGLFALYLFGRAWTRPPMIPRVGTLAVFVICFVVVHIPFATETRHLKPIVPVALAVAMPTAVALIERLRRRSSEGARSALEFRSSRLKLD